MGKDHMVTTISPHKLKFYIECLSPAKCNSFGLPAPRSHAAELGRSYSGRWPGRRRAALSAVWYWAARTTWLLTPSPSVEGTISVVSKRIIQFSPKHHWSECQRGYFWIGWSRSPHLATGRVGEELPVGILDCVGSRMIGETVQFHRW